MAQPNTNAANVDMDNTGSNTQAGFNGGVDRRERLHHTIKSLIALRQDVFLKFGRLAGISSFDARENETHSVQSSELRTFCQIMVDYTAMGHFEIYQRIIDGKERRKAIKDIAQEVYPAIAETTDFLIDFNDKYDDFDGSSDEVEMLSSDLSRLGQILSVRGELEDQILAALAG